MSVYMYIFIGEVSTLRFFKKTSAVLPSTPQVAPTQAPEDSTIHSTALLYTNSNSIVLVLYYCSMMGAQALLLVLVLVLVLV